MQSAYVRHLDVSKKAQQTAQRLQPDHISREEKKEIAMAWEMFDTDRDGLIEYRSLKTCLKGLGFAAKKKDVLELMHKHGKEKSDFIDFGTFETMMLDAYGGRTFAELVDRAFDIFDPQDRGFIDTRSLKQVVQQIGENISDEELKSMITMFDINGDGRIDKEEFRSILKVFDPDRSCEDEDDW